MKRMLILGAVSLLSLTGAKVAVAAEASPIFGSADVKVNTVADNKGVVGKGYYADYYGYYGNYYANQASYYGNLGMYYKGYSYYYSAYSYASSAATDYYYAYYYQLHGQ